MDPNQNLSPIQNQNQNPSPNQYDNTPPQNQQPVAGFGAWSNLLHHGFMSPTIPNQRLYTASSSPPIQFHQIQQNINPQTTYFNQNFNDPRAFRQPEFDNPNFYSGGSSQQPSQQPSEEEVVVETQMPQPKPTTRKKAPRKKATNTPQVQSEILPWYDDELIALADAWCTTSLDEVKGNDQKTDTYWKAM